MSCEACERFWESGGSYPFRWRAATVGIIACEQHAQELIEALRVAQGPKRPEERESQP